MKITFNNNNSAFSIALRKKVEGYFSTGEYKLTGNKKLYIKTAILLSLAVSTYLILLLASPGIFISIALCALLGLNLAAIGFNVMHDGAHGSYSTKKWVNEIMAYTLNLMGGCTYFWKQKHNISHHNFTNIEGHDDDIDIKPWIRTNANQPRHWFHRYQHIYSMFLYTLSYISWVAGKDFKRYITGKIGDFQMKKMNFKEHVIFWVSKIVYFSIFIAIPIAVLGLLKTVIGYLVLSFVCGIVLSVVFQLAHVVEPLGFPLPSGDNNKINNDWTIHQLATTANFSTRNKIISWYVGGLNFQVEHHLFPRISHVHYPAISKLVKEVCAQFNVQYMEYPTLTQAIRSHIAHLRHVGMQP